MTQTFIKVDDVSHVFPPPDGGGEVVALENINVDIRRGEMVSLIGPSGCGKSTLLNVIGGMINPTSGRALIGEAPVRGPRPKEVAYIFQESALLPWATILDNIKVSLEFQKAPRASRDQIARDALKAVGLDAFAASYPHQLSGGMKQRAALARALSLRTDVLLMDEPFAALDEQTRMIFSEDLSRLLANERKTILLVTHSLAEAVFLSDRIFVFTSRPGRIKAVLEVDEPHPRKPGFMTSARFNELRNQLYELLRDEVLAAIGKDRQGLA
ncbi:MAG: ABC transporter ATP-binding protein [Beijerinckiaceae bacterium]|jgi:NitT/TauT family transport system ATP-binding protein